MPGFNMDDYVPVNERIAAFLEKHPHGSLQCDIIEMTEDRVTVKAYAYRTADDMRPGTGLASEPIPGRTSFTQGSEVENAETSAWGRAIAALGFEVKRGIASREEMRRQQPDRSEREAQAGRRGSRHPATTSGPARTPEEQALLDELLALPGMTIARMSLLADAAHVEKGTRATTAQLREMLRIAQTPLEQPEATSAHAAPVASAPAAGVGEAGSSVPASPEDTPSTEGMTASAVSEAATTPAAAASPPPSPGSAPSLDDVLAVTGGELLPPKPGTDPYKALPAHEKAKARAYWQSHPDEPQQETLAEALGSPVVAE